LQQVLAAVQVLLLQRPAPRPLGPRPQQLQLPPQLGAALHQADVLRLRLRQRMLQVLGALPLAQELPLRRGLPLLGLCQPRLQQRQLLALALQLLQQRALLAAAAVRGGAAGGQLVDGALARQQRILQLRDGAVLGVQRLLPVGARLLGAALRGFGDGGGGGGARQAAVVRAAGGRGWLRTTSCMCCSRSSSSSISLSLRPARSLRACEARGGASLAPRPPRPLPEPRTGRARGHLVLLARHPKAGRRLVVRAGAHC
jgi:hypothetical protein